MNTSSGSAANWKHIVTGLLLWCGFTLLLVAAKLNQLPAAGTRIIRGGNASSAVAPPLVRVAAGNELVSGDQKYETLVEWCRSVRQTPLQPVVIAAHPKARAQAVERIVQWLQSRGVRRVVVVIDATESGS